MTDDERDWHELDSLIEPYLCVYRTVWGQRVIVGYGILIDLPAAIEGTNDWIRRFELARRLGIEIKPAFDYDGPVHQ